MANKVVALWNGKPKQTLVVGDTIYDMELGQRAGCKTCGVSYGNQTKEQLEEQGAGVVIDQMESLLTLME